jgi:prefoldin subunit 5
VNTSAITRLAVHIEAFLAGWAETFTFAELRDGGEVVVSVGCGVVVMAESWATLPMPS